MQSESQSAVEVVVLKREEVTAERIGALCTDVQRDIIIVLDDKGLDETIKGENGDFVYGGESTLTAVKSKVEGFITSDRVTVCDVLPTHIGGHNKVYKTGEYIVRRHLEGAAILDTEVQRVCDEVAESGPGLVKQHLIMADPRSEENSLRQLTVQDMCDGVRWSDIAHEATMQQHLAVMRILNQTLARMHKAGVIHRDVKPGNVMVDGTNVMLMDRDLATPIGTVNEGWAQGTPPYPTEERPADDHPDVLRPLVPATDFAKLGLFVRKMLLIRQREGEQEELIGAHTGIQQLLDALRQSYESPHSVCRPGAQQGTAALDAIEQRMGEHDNEYLEITQELRRALLCAGDNPDPQAMLDQVRNPEQLVEVLEVFLGGNPEFLDSTTEHTLAWLKVACGDRLAGEAAVDAADERYAEAMEHFLRTLQSIPLRYSMDRCAGYLELIARKRADNRPDRAGYDFNREGSAWGTVSGHLKHDWQDNHQLLSQCTRADNAPIEKILECARRLGEEHRQACEPDLWNEDRIVQSLEHGASGEIAWWRALVDDEDVHAASEESPLQAVQIRVTAMLSKYLHNFFELEVSSGEPMRNQARLEEALAVSDTLLVLDRNPSAQFWFLRAMIFRRLEEVRRIGEGGSNIDPTSWQSVCARRAYERAHHQAPQDPTIVRFAAEHIDALGDHQAALEVMEAVPQVRRDSVFNLSMSRMQEEGGDEQVALLAEAALFDTGNPIIALDRMELEFGKGIPDMEVIERCADIVFSTNVREGRQALMSGFARICQDETKNLNQYYAIRLYDRWKEWDTSDEPKKCMLYVAHTRGWKSVVLRISMELGVVWPKEVEGETVAFMQQLGASVTRDEAIDLCMQNLSTAAGLQHLRVVELDEHAADEAVVQEVGDKSEADTITIKIGDEDSRLALRFQLNEGEELTDRFPIVLYCAQAIESALRSQQLVTAAVERRSWISAGAMQARMQPEVPKLPGYEVAYRCEQQFHVDAAGEEILGGDAVLLSVERDTLCGGILDAAGHEPAAAPVVLKAIAYLEVACSNALDDPAHALTQVHDRILGTTANRFLTGVLYTLDSKTGKGRIAAAAHPLPLIIASNGTVRVLKLTTSLPLGLEYQDGEWDLPISANFELAEGETLVVYSDGVADAGAGHEEQEMLEDTGIRELLAQMPGAAPQEMVDALFEEARRRGLMDNTTVLAVRRDAL